MREQERPRVHWQDAGSQHVDPQVVRHPIREAGRVHLCGAKDCCQNEDDLALDIRPGQHVEKWWQQGPKPRRKLRRLICTGLVALGTMPAAASRIWFMAANRYLHANQMSSSGAV